MNARSPLAAASPRAPERTSSGVSRPSERAASAEGRDRLPGRGDWIRTVSNTAAKMMPAHCKRGAAGPTPEVSQDRQKCDERDCNPQRELRRGVRNSQCPVGMVSRRVRRAVAVSTTASGTLIRKISRQSALTRRPLTGAPPRRPRLRHRPRYRRRARGHDGCSRPGRQGADVCPDRVRSDHGVHRIVRHMTLRRRRRERSCPRRSKGRWLDG